MPWQTLRSTIVFKNNWLSLVKSDVISPAGKPGTYTIIETRPFIMVVARRGDELLMVQQDRFTLNATTIEFPAGGIEEGEQPLAAAKRELAEETGYTAKNWRLLCELDDAVGISRHKAYIFEATNLTDTPKKTNDEAVDSHKWLPVKELQTMVDSNQITDTKTIAILYKATKR